jgi:two-component system heavy metal sensor histidine kinase CusS
LSLQGHAAEVQGDRAMLRQALSNILSNAIRYTPANNTITAMLEVADDSVKLSVENPGSDIPEKHIDKLFNRFYRADPSRQRDTDGAGLGLAIAQAVIQIHNGFINVHSSHGITIFTITLPRKPTAFNLNGEK